MTSPDTNLPTGVQWQKMYGAPAIAMYGPGYEPQQPATTTYQAAGALAMQGVETDKPQAPATHYDDGAHFDGHVGFTD